MENYSLSDVAAVTGENGFGGGAWVMIILFALIFGGNGLFGNRNNDAATNEILFGQQFANLDNKIDRIGNGIADATFALNNSIKDGNYAVSSAVGTEGRTLSSQIADCCCTTQRNIDSVRFDMSNYNASTNATITAQTQKVLDAIAQNKIETLQGRVNQLEMQNALCGVVRYPNSMAYSAGTSPFCNCSGCGM